MMWGSANDTMAAASPVGDAAIVVVYVTMLGLMISLIIAPEMRPVSYAYGTIVCIAVVVIPMTMPYKALAPHGYPAEPAVYGAFISILAWGRGWARFVGAATVVAVGLATFWYSQDESAYQVPNTWRVFLVMSIVCVATYVVVTTGLRIAERIDDSRAVLRDTLADASLARAELLEREEFDRFLHDDILHTLRMAALADHIDPQATRASARDVLDELDARTTTTSTQPVALIDELQKLGESCPLQVDLTVHGSIAPAVPRTVALAMLRAAQEALRNVQRHAGVDRATIEVHSTNTSLAIDVADDGVGFAPESSRRGRLGIEHSIRSRLMAVDGHATVSSAPGTGTRIRLTWRDPHHARVLLRSAFLEFRELCHTAVSTATGASLAIMLVAGSADLRLFEHPEIQVAAAASIALAWAVFTVATRHRDLNGRGSATLAAVAIIAPFIAATHLPNGYPPGWILWMASGPSPLITIVIFYRPMREGVAVTVSCSVALWTAFLMTPHADYPSTLYVGSYLSPLLYGITAFVLRLTTDIALTAADAIVEKEAAAQVELDRTQVQNRVSRIRMHEIALDVRPLLTDLADGTLTPADAAARATRLEHAVRDALISTTTARLRRTITDLRAVGWHIDFRRSTPAPTQSPAASEPADLIEVLNGLPAPLAAGHLVITLAERPTERGAEPLGSGQTHWTLLATTPTPELRTHLATAATELGARHTDDPDYVSLGSP